MRLRKRARDVKIVSPKPGQIQGMNHADKGDKFDVDIAIRKMRIPTEFDALMIPGGVDESDQLRSTHRQRWILPRHFSNAGKPVAGDLPRAVGAD